MRARVSLPLLVAVVAAVLQLPASASAPPGIGHDRPLPGVVSGQAAIKALGDNAARVARQNGMSEERLLDLLATDPTVQLDSQGRMRYADVARPASAGVAVEPAAAQFPYSETFKLHSLPGANRVIYLDFNGHNVSGTSWNDEGLPAKTYAGLNFDGNPDFSAAEQDVVQDVWQRAAEDFAPFRIDVTTEDPGAAALNRTDGNDTQFGMRALITSDPTAPLDLCGGCAGIAYVDVFNVSNSANFQPAWAFVDTAGAPDTAILADTISHEVGHTFSLDHDGKGFAEYYEGQGIWQPIMGSGWPPLSQFSNGDYGGTNPEDDFAVIDDNGGPLRVDDHADTAASGTVIDESASKTGVISTRTDVDWFTVEQGCTGPLSIDVETVDLGPNLDAQLRVETSGGSPIATINPTADFDPEGSGGLIGLDAAYSGNQPEGTYRFRVDGVGQGSPTVDGYSDYGSRGFYTVSVFTSCPPPHPPTAPRNLTVSPTSNGQAATLEWDPPRGPGGTITGYTVQRTGGTPVNLSGSASEHTFSGLTPATAYTFSVIATNALGDGPAATVSASTAGPASAPTFLSVFPGQPGEAFLIWSPPDSDGGLPITGYEVQRTGAAPVPLEEFETSHTFTGLTAGVSYTLSVRAVTAFGLGAVATVPWLEGAPGLPFANAEAMSPTSVKVTWEPGESGSSPINGYTVGIEGGSSVNLTADKREHTFNGLTPDTDYEFYVQAKNTVGTGPKGTAFATTPTAPRVPGPVNFLSIDEVTGSTVEFSWQFPADWGLPELDTFQVRLDSGPWFDKTADPFDPFPSHTFTGLAAGTAYTVSVRAVNATGNGPVESLPFTTDGSAKPGAPTIGTAKSGAAGGKVTAKAVWSPPLSDGGSPITNYKVTALKMSSSGAVLSKTTKKVGPSARALTMTLKKGKYRFQVVAINAVGASKASARSNLVTAR